MFFILFLIDMIFVTYDQSSGGRSGHKLCEIFTCFILEALLDLKPVYHNSWNSNDRLDRSQKILKKESLMKNCFPLPNDKFNYCLGNGVQNWNCMTFKDYNDLKIKLETLQKNHSNIYVCINGVNKIHPHNVYSWYINKLINDDIYHQKIIPKLKKIYFDRNTSFKINAIALHIRSGDLTETIRKQTGISGDYYIKLLNELKKLDMPINIYSEPVRNTCDNNSSFLNNLKGPRISNFYEGENKFEEHFNYLARHKILILSPSNMALWAGYINEGIVLIDKKFIEWRYRAFEGSENIFNVYNDVNEIIPIIKSKTI